MEIICTRPHCTKPRNFFSDLDTESKIRTVQQRYCRCCGMPLILADRYLPLKLLGQGGFGAAFLARDRYTPKLPLCVVKQFKPADNLSDQEKVLAQQLFEREADVLAELGKKHPQIPELYAFFPLVPDQQGANQEQYFYLAQEFIDGQNLEQELAAQGTFSEAKVRKVLVEILKVLAFIHENNTIHRDIKPSNIMRNQQGKLYLLDFGAVKQIAIGGGNQKKSTGIYSMGFAPPEQVSGLEVYPATDIYALAVTCLNLLTNKPAEELYDSYTNTWQWHKFVPQTSDRLKQVFDRMLLPSPCDRFQSARETLAALDIPSPPTPNPPDPNLPTPNLPTPTPTKRSFSLVEVLSDVAFAGFEGGLISMGMISWLNFSGVSLGIIGAVMGGITFALNRRIIEKVDLIIIALISVGVVAFIPKFHAGLGLTSPEVLLIATMSGAGAIAVYVFFRLVYKLLSRFLS